MIQKKVIIKDVVMLDIENIADHIIKHSTTEHAERYAKKLMEEISTLSYMAEVRPQSQWNLPKRYAQNAKTMPIARKKLTIIFHIEGEYVIVDKIMPSSLITY